MLTWVQTIAPLPTLDFLPLFGQLLKTQPHARKSREQLNLSFPHGKDLSHM